MREVKQMDKSDFIFNDGSSEIFLIEQFREAIIAKLNELETRIEQLEAN